MRTQWTTAWYGWHSLQGQCRYVVSKFNNFSFITGVKNAGIQFINKIRYKEESWLHACLQTTVI